MIRKGPRFDLCKYTDPATGFIFEVERRRGLRAGAAGLNGAMARWNTVKLDVLNTFGEGRVIFCASAPLPVRRSRGIRRENNVPASYRAVSYGLKTQGNSLSCRLSINFRYDPASEIAKNSFCVFQPPLPSFQSAIASGLLIPWA